MVSIASIHPEVFYDPTCIIQAGEHPFIQHTSYALYKFADTMHYRGIITHVTSSNYIPREDMEEGLLDRVRDGILVSKFTPRRIKSYYRINGN